ncbi:hypothetical protein BC938DRAFT_474740, partial [Jimgerdemannia flammicorona]
PPPDLRLRRYSLYSFHTAHPDLQASVITLASVDTGLSFHTALSDMSDSTNDNDYFNLAGTEDNTEEDNGEHTPGPNNTNTITPQRRPPVPGSSGSRGFDLGNLLPADEPPLPPTIRTPASETTTTTSRPHFRDRSGSTDSASSISAVRQQRRAQQQQQQQDAATLAFAQRRPSQPLLSLDTNPHSSNTTSVASAPASPRHVQMAYHEPSKSRIAHPRTHSYTATSSGLPPVSAPSALHRRRMAGSNLRGGNSVSMQSEEEGEEADEEGEAEEDPGVEGESSRARWGRPRRGALNRRHTYHNEQDPVEFLADLEREAEEGNEAEVAQFDGELTLKDRQDVMNKVHPFGLPIWKPALYKKSRSIVRNANSSLHLSPPQQPELYLYPGNILWTLVFGWWLSLVCLAVSLLLYLTPGGGPAYGRVLRELAGYLFWPFGRYVERRVPIVDDGDEDDDEEIPLLSGRRERKGRRARAWWTFREEEGGEIAPLQLLVTSLCWFIVITIPMAKLNWVLLRHLRRHPLTLHFKSGGSTLLPSFDSTTDRAIILLCTYQAIGLQYYKYTYDGINIIFINLLPLCIFVIADEYLIHHWFPNSPIGAPQTVFFLSLASVVPLSYFIGMAVSSISAQSSMGVGAVINATFGSIIEIILYAVALRQGKAVLLFGRVVVDARREYGVRGGQEEGTEEGREMSETGAAIDDLTPPTIFVRSFVYYDLRLLPRNPRCHFHHAHHGPDRLPDAHTLLQYLRIGTFLFTSRPFDLRCTSCPSAVGSCSRCYHTTPDPGSDPVYQNNVKPLILFCAIVLPLAYIIGLWFSLHTHVKQIWQQTTRDHHLSVAGPPGASTGDASTFRRLLPSHMLSQILPGHQPALTPDTGGEVQHPHQPPSPRRAHSSGSPGDSLGSTLGGANVASEDPSAVAQHPSQSRPPHGHGGDAVAMAAHPPIPVSGGGGGSVHAGSVHAGSVHAGSVHAHTPPVTQPTIPAVERGEEEVVDEEAAGHDSPNWSKEKSVVVLLGCTVLYSLIAGRFWDGIWRPARKDEN